MSDVPYSKKFFDFHKQGAHRSAAAVVPMVLEIVSPQSVVDVGCGIGSWLSEFKAAGVADYLGIDGAYVDRSQIEIEPERFLSRDLAQPFEIGRRFDLAVCLEVAEHIEPQSAGTLVDSLVRLAPVLLFSAAIPCQHGTGHVNEQWPEFWRDLFAARDYVVADVLRDRLWLKQDIEVWYRQNLLFFVDRARLADYPLLHDQFQRAGDAPYLSRVHPEVVVELFAHSRKRIHLVRCESMRMLLQLRQISLLVFPDWTLPKQTVLDELRGLLSAVCTHPDSRRMTVVVNVGLDYACTAPLANQAFSEATAATNVPQASTPTFSLFGGSFGAQNWNVLLDCVQGRIMLPGAEDTQAVASANAGDLPIVTLEAIRHKQPFGI